MLDALTFVLFNKPFRKINKLQLINSVNEKDRTVEIEFSTGSIEWKVICIKPMWRSTRTKNFLNCAAAASDQQKEGRECSETELQVIHSNRHPG